MTDYTAAGITVRIGRRSADMDRLLMAHRQRAAVFITAYNPFSRSMPAAWNRRIQARLLQNLRGCPVLPASGRWGHWCEAHFLAFAPHRPMIVLARRYRQHGIVTVRLRQPARLIITSSWAR
jgi:hypothetical protein